MNERTKLSLGLRDPGEIILKPTLLARNSCRACVGWSNMNHRIENCPFSECWFFSKRFGYNRTPESVISSAGHEPKKVTHILNRGRNPNEYTTGLKMIRLHCVNNCCDGSPAEVRKCPVTKCWSWPLRFGYRTKAKEIIKLEKEKMDEIQDFLAKHPDSNWGHILDDTGD